MAKRKQRSAVEDAETIAFDYYEYIRVLVRDLEHIDKLIPAETSRFTLDRMDAEAKAIIQSRKNHLLEYIQVVCRDHIHWGKKLMDGGWTVKQRKRAKYKRSTV